MGYSALSDPFLQLAFWVGTGALGFTLLLGAQIVLLRMSLRRRQQREKAVIEKWRPLLNAAMFGEPLSTFPPLLPEEHNVFFKLWIHLHQSLRGEASAGLNAVAYRLQCDRIARRQLRRGGRAQRLLAILVLGHMRDRAAWQALIEQTQLDDSTTSIQALWALVQIDAQTAVRQMLPLCIQRRDWSLSQIVNILCEARDACVPVLAEAIEENNIDTLPRILRLAEALRVNLPAPLLAGLLRHRSIDVVAATLRLVRTPALLDQVRAHLAHTDWSVRVQVAKALGRIGDRSDVARLQQLLADPQWWVRYRAAQSLVALPFLAPEEIEALRAGATDRYAGDMLGQVFAERGYA